MHRLGGGLPSIQPIAAGNGVAKVEMVPLKPWYQNNAVMLCIAHNLQFLKLQLFSGSVFCWIASNCIFWVVVNCLIMGVLV